MAINFLAISNYDVDNNTIENEFITVKSKFFPKKQVVREGFLKLYCKVQSIEFYLKISEEGSSQLKLQKFDIPYQTLKNLQLLISELEATENEISEDEY